VRRIRDGTVIDHIPPGRSLLVLSTLGITGKEGFVVSAGMNVASGKMGRKDIIKVEGRNLAPGETDKISLIARNATVNIIRNFKVVERRKVELPAIFISVIKCTNPTCISNSGEVITPVIDVVNKETPLLRCKYCKRAISPDEFWSLPRVNCLPLRSRCPIDGSSIMP
jgi:aspartate carbamoyltransferase regulatory subunit